ncbi:arginine N-succinyltransferase [Planctomicrobium piriforme]|uniref:Arginine N-succinyltransferase n=1 Tax=Planctomicrobium piriforme TaxID=1576369 RepID=A0A1I3T0E3_9PLAN|nr:arginine N-succinyltransferase [Planctomicrobium piriforme]SFJ64578.1 arginine N-succinyltransferase [Planctomicrobium piriforme]
MFVVRPVELSDLDRLLDLAELTSFGLTTLPKDRALLEKRIKGSKRSFQNLDDDEPGGESYLFVMEETSTRLAQGTCGLIAKVGGFEPFYLYRIETSVHDSRMLNVRKEIPVLHLEEDHNGPCEIGSLFLHPESRHSGNGRVLSLSRFLFMAEYPKLFDPEVLAEMRGVIDEQGRSPFWDALGKHFFDLEFPKADYLSIVNKEFIGDLMPRYPIYIPLLPPEAQAVIGEVHELTRPARRLLESEGFTYQNCVDIFEAGPMLHCHRDRIRSIRESRCGTVTAIHDRVPTETEYLVSSRAQGFRACRGFLQINGQGLELSTEAAVALKVSIGDLLRYVPLKAGIRSQTEPGA